MNIFVTGASGFIGKEFSIKANKLNNLRVKAITRKYINNFPKEIDQIIVPDINANTKWTTPAKGSHSLVATVRGQSSQSFAISIIEVNIN